MSDHPSLSELDGATPFVERHVGLRPDDEARMLAAVGHASLEELMDAAVPAAIRSEAVLDLPRPLSEAGTAKELRQLAAANRPAEAMIGLGYHATITPPVIRRNVLEDPSWYTAYTPYQPEISQGRLEALLNFQTMVSDLTGLDIANASLLDESTAAAEAMAMAQRVAKSKSLTFFADENCHPQNIELLKTRAEPLGWNVVVGDPFVVLLVLILLARDLGEHAVVAVGGAAVMRRTRMPD